MVRLTAVPSGDTHTVTVSRDSAWMHIHCTTCHQDWSYAPPRDAYTTDRAVDACLNALDHHPGTRFARPMADTWTGTTVP